MHFRSVFYVLGNLLVVLGGAMVLPLLVSILADDGHLPLERYEVVGFLGAIALATISGMALRTVFETDLSRLGNREGCAIVTLTWLLFSLVGCMPLLVTGAAGFTDAYYETISGFTTTGASILPEMEVLPSGIALWRCQTQWMGGMGIVVLSVAILPFLGMGGYRMFKAEVPGGSTFERNAPRIKDIAKVLWIMYLALTVFEVGLLLAGGMGLHDAVCHGFTTMSTGGFSTSTRSVAHWISPWIQWVVITFMFLAGTNFSIYHQLITGPRATALSNPEFKVYVVLAAVLTAICFGVLVRSGTMAGGEPALRASAFQVVSLGTSTGFGTEDFDRWPDLLRLLLMLLMFVGGCTGSTGGGMKVARVVIFFKAAVVELRRTINPRAVLVVRVGDRALEREVVSNIMSFLAMYIGLFTLATVVLTLLGLDLMSASSAAVANLSNIGPGLSTVGPTASYAHVPALGKWLLVLCQLLGRLELYSVMVLFLRRTWTR
jgi:trk system potassium uptake protein TrkH